MVGGFIMRFGILGCQHAHIVMFIEEMLKLGHIFIGICEIDIKLAEDLAKKYNVPLLSNWNELFALKPDIVGTSAVNNRKIDVIESCVKRGMHIMADKPLVTDMKGYERLLKVLNERNAQVGLMLTERFNPAVYTAWKMIKENKIGEPISFNFLKPHKLLEKSRPSWHFSRRENGGLLIDLLIHDFDLLQWFTQSNIEECHGYIKKTGYSEYPYFFDSVNIIAKTRNGVVATFEADWRMPDAYWSWGDGRIFCIGSCGRFEIKTVGDINMKKEPFVLSVTRDKEINTIVNEVISTTLTEDFLKRISGKKDVVIKEDDIINATYATLIADKNVIEIV
jgi:predicted dehydrogenase